MGWLELLFGLRQGSDILDRPQTEIDREAERIAAAADDETVSAPVLANHHDRSKLPLLTYFEDGEHPQYVFRGGVLLVSDGADDLARRHPTRELQVVVTNRRLLFVVGNQRSDDVLAVAFEDVREAYLDRDSWRRYLVVDARTDGDPMTFFADLTLDTRSELLEAAVDSLARRSGGVGREE